MQKIAIITGASSGIGYYTAITLAKNNYNLIITGRRLQKLQDLKNKIETETNVKVYVLNFDICNNQDVINAFSTLPNSWKNIDILINNAGLALGAEPIQDAKIEDWEKMIDTNIKGLLFVSKQIIPGMIEKKSGHIINIGSIAGKEVYPNGNIYCSSKFAVDAITKAMRIDLLQTGIKVTQIAPGMVETEFSKVRYKGDETKAEAVYKGIVPLNGQDVADTILFVITRPAHVNINDIILMPTQQANTSYVNRFQD